MSSLQLPHAAIPKPLPEDDDDVSWALQTAAVQWGRGAHSDAVVWLRRAAEAAIESSSWSRAADLNATAAKLEKQLSRSLAPSGPPSLPPSNGPTSAPPRAAILPSFPAPTTTAPPPPGVSPDPRRQTTGYSSMPPLPRRGNASSQTPSGRSSVVIDVEEGELEITDEELRELESKEMTSEIPSGASAPRPSRPEALPAFSLESSRPASPTRPPTGLAAFASGFPSTQRPNRQTSSAAPSFPARERSAESGPPSLPAFPLEGGGSSLPPVSKWPRLGSHGTSHLPPTPGVPAFETAPPSKPFVDDGDDGTPGLEELSPIYQETYSEELAEPPTENRQTFGYESRPLESDNPTAPPPPLPTVARRRVDLSGGLELQEMDFSKKPRVLSNSAKPTPPLSSQRPARGAAPLPPALPLGRSVEPRAESRTDHARPNPNELSLASRVPTLTSAAPPAPPHAANADPPVTSPRRSVQALQKPGTSSGLIEPRMPVRTYSYSSPLDLRSPERRGGDPEADSAGASEPPTSVDPIATDRASKRASETSSVAPPASARSIEPEDLPTVSSPSLSRPPPEARDLARDGRVDTLPSHRPFGIGSEYRSTSNAPAERRRLSFKFEEQRPGAPGSARSERPPLPQAAEPTELGAFFSAPPSAPAQAIVEEPLASLPPVVTRGSGLPSAGKSDSPGASDESDQVIIAGIRLADVRGFADLPVSAHRMLAATARIESLATGEEASFFSVALVLDGWVGLMPAIADTACATAVVGEVVFTEGTLTDGLMLRVVAGQDDVVVATWDTQAIAEATKECPWVADDLRLLADGFQALAGACLGPLGDRLDDALRSIVTSRCEIRTLLPGEQLCASNKIVPGMHIIGGGDVELVDDNGRIAKVHGTGEFLFPPQVLAGGVAPYSARAGKKGALVLFAPRMAAHELLVSVPPLLEILAD